MNKPDAPRNAQGAAIDWPAFRAEIDGIRVYDDPKLVEARSRDYFWYSPILNEQLDGVRGDLVVMPKDQDEVMRVAAAVARHRVPLTLRGGGTGNYGQCVPLEGGVVMDLTKLDRVIEITEGRVHCEAGIRISRLDDAARETGQELLMYPSTRQMATIGGFLAGGSGGIGSLRHGMLRDPGNITYCKVITVEPEPQVIELHGEEIQKVQHAYGTNGIVTELELALTPSTDWIHCAALFDGYDTALRFAQTAQEEGLDCYLLTTVERRFAPYYRKFGDLFPADRDAVFAMVAPAEMERFTARAEQMGGTIPFAMTKPEIREAGLQPAYECGWNHTTLQALKADKGWTYLQVA
ncbi:FAD-binding oxidoreductase, partial [Cribrihabitans sp. XS_ASV171]